MTFWDFAAAHPVLTVILAAIGFITIEQPIAHISAAFASRGRKGNES